MKMKKMLAISSAVAIMLCASLTNASAETSLTTWNLNTEPSSASTTTVLRPKTTSSGVYVYYEGGTHASLRCDVLNRYNISKCRGRIGSISRGAAGRIAQWVYEDGERECKLKVSGGYSYGGANGKWSPDTTTTVPYIN